MHIPDIKHLPLGVIGLSFIDVDCDLNAERLMVINRKTGATIAHKRIESGNFKAILKEEYALSNDFMCIMIDDNGAYNAAIADNVQPMLINLATFDPANPLPYEPPV